MAYFQLCFVHLDVLLRKGGLHFFLDLQHLHLFNLLLKFVGKRQLLFQVQRFLCHADLACLDVIHHLNLLVGVEPALELFYVIFALRSSMPERGISRISLRLGIGRSWEISMQPCFNRNCTSILLRELSRKEANYDISLVMSASSCFSLASCSSSPFAKSSASLYLRSRSASSLRRLKRVSSAFRRACSLPS